MLRLRGHTDIQKRDARSAVMTFGKALGLSSDDVPAGPIYIRRKLESISYVAVGYSKGRWVNIKTGVARGWPCGQKLPKPQHNSAAAAMGGAFEDAAGVA